MSKSIIKAWSLSRVHACVFVCARVPMTQRLTASPCAKGYAPTCLGSFAYCVYAMWSHSTVHEWRRWLKHRLKDYKSVLPPSLSLCTLLAAVGFSVADNVVAISLNVSMLTWNKTAWKPWTIWEHAPTLLTVHWLILIICLDGHGD